MSSQPLQALRIANAVRLPRAALMRQLRTREVLFRDLDLSDPCLQSMHVYELLQCLPWKHDSGLSNGRTVARVATRGPQRILYHVALPASITVARLSVPTRKRLVEAVERFCCTQRDG